MHHGVPYMKELYVGSGARQSGQSEREDGPRSSLKQFFVASSLLYLDHCELYIRTPASLDSSSGLRGFIESGMRIIIFTLQKLCSIWRRSAARGAVGASRALSTRRTPTSRWARQPTGAGALGELAG